MLVLRSAFLMRRVAAHKHSGSTRAAKARRDNGNGWVVRCDKPDRETRSRSSRIVASTGAVCVGPAQALGNGGRLRNRGSRPFRANSRFPFPLRAEAAQAMFHPAATPPSAFRLSRANLSTCQPMWLEG